MAKQKERKENLGGPKKKKSLMLIVLGILVLANAYLSVVSWAVFIGVIAIVAGLIKMMMPRYY